MTAQVTSSGPSSGATTGESVSHYACSLFRRALPDRQLLESVKSATGFGQTRTEQAGQSVADGAKSFGQGAKDELNAVSAHRPELVYRAYTDLPDVLWTKQRCHHR
jgi:hypothetical protein